MSIYFNNLPPINKQPNNLKPTPQKQSSSLDQLSILDINGIKKLTPQQTRELNSIMVMKNK